MNENKVIKIGMVGMLVGTTYSISQITKLKQEVFMLEQGFNYRGYQIQELESMIKNQELETIMQSTSIQDLRTYVEEQTSDLRLSDDEVWQKPCAISDFKSWMDYRTITNTSTTQYKLQQGAYTEDGFRKYQGRFMVATSFANVDYVGQKITLRFKDGTKLKAIVGDIKSNNDTNGCSHPDSSVFEFIVDTDTLSDVSKKNGQVFQHSGAVVEILKGE